MNAHLLHSLFLGFSPFDPTLAKELAGTRVDYHRIGYDRRPMVLEPDGLIGEGSDRMERRWTVHSEDGIPVLTISGDDGITARLLRETGDGIRYKGRWAIHENMPVEITILDEGSKGSRTPLDGKSHEVIAGPKRLLSQIPVDQPLIYTRVGYDARRISLNEDGTIQGGGHREAYWSTDLNHDNGTLVIYARDRRITTVFYRDGTNEWKGQWRHFERMPVELKVPRFTGSSAQTDYSQNGEQQFILEFFHGYRSGYFLDIGAADGIVDSNTRALALMAWRGTLVEPVDEEFRRLKLAYSGYPGITLINAAVSETDGHIKMWVADQSGNARYGAADNRHTLLGTVKENAMRHPHRNAVYDVQDVHSMRPSTLVMQLPEQIDFLSVDAEGMDGWIISELLDLGMRPRLIMCENDKTTVKDFTSSLVARGYQELYRTTANSAWAIS